MPGSKRGPKIPTKTRGFVNEAAITYPDVDREELANVVRVQLASKGWMTPSVETVKKMISAARNSTTTEDEQWCIGESSLYGLSTTNNDLLLSIWKWCVIVGRPFTIREAKWVTRLCNISKNDSVFIYAIDYAVRERLWEMEKESDPNTKFDTSDLDANIAFEDETWTRLNGLHTGVLKESDRIKYREEDEMLKDLPPLLRAGIIGDPGAIALASIFGFPYEPTSLPQPRYLPEEGSNIYALWITRLSKGKRWQNGDVDDTRKVEIATWLYDEIAEVADKIELAKENKDWGEVWRLRRSWLPPIEMLHEVGLDLGVDINIDYPQTNSE